jgi:hypothetical protein
MFFPVRNSFIGKFFPLTAGILLAALPSMAQETSGSISGVIRDPQAAVIPGAKVVLTNEAQGTVAGELATTADGAFSFSPVLPGRYSIAVEAAGFKKYIQSGITLNIGDKLSLPAVSMELGAVGESVSVEAEAVQLQTVTAERAGVVDGKQIVDVALNGRNFNNLLRTVPGALADGTLSVNGQRTDEGNFTVDGQTVIDTGVNVQTNFGYRISVDAMAEFKVSSNAMGAEFGRNSGAQIQIVTKSGTKDFHGGAYWFKRGEFMNANTFINNETPTLQANGKVAPQFPIYRYMTLGWNIGGPVYIPGHFNKDKNKLFFFVSQEWNRQTTPHAPDQITVPTALQRTGNFSQTVDASGALVPIYNPAATTPSGQKVQFPGNIIPPSLFNQYGQAVLNFLPLPNISGNPSFNYQSQVPATSPEFDEVYRVDYNINDKWHAFFRTLVSHNTQNNPYGTGAEANVLALSPLLAKTFAWPNFTGNLTTIISPTLTNEFQYGYTKNGIPDVPPASGSPYYRTTSNLQIPLLFPNADPSGLVPNFGFGGVPGPSFLTTQSLVSEFFGLPYANANPIWNFIDNVNKVHGNHSIKMGFFFEHAIKLESAFGDTNSTISFARDANNPNDSNWAFSNALLGNFDTYDQFSSYPVGNYVYTNTEWYAQDSWKATPKLTLNYGIRFNLVPPTYSETNRIASFVPSLYNPANAVRLFQPAVIGGKDVAYDPVTGEQLPFGYVGYIVPNSGDVNNGNASAGVNGEPRGLTASRGVQYGPRLGLAYAIDNKTVFRAGGGVFYERVVAGMTRTQATDPPFVRDPELLYGNLSSIASSSSIQSPVGISGLSGDGHIPTVYNFSAGIQRELPIKFLLDVSYVGSISRHLVMLYPINDTPFGSAWLPQNQDPTLGAPKDNGTTTENPNLYRPYLGYSGPVTSSFSNYGYIDNFGGTANYNALQVALNRRVADFSFGLQYSWSKALGVNSSLGNSCSFGAQCGVTPGDVRTTDYGPLNFDRTQQATFNYIYSIPGGARKGTFLDNAAGRLVLGGWQLSGLTSMSGGAPVNATYSVTGIGSTLLNQEITGSYDVAPRVVLTCNPNLSGSGSLYAFVNTSCFAPASVGSVGADSGINRLRGPGLQNWDMSLFKRIPLGKSETRFIQLRLEAFNVFNHPEWASFNSTIQFNSAGKIVNLPTAEGGTGGQFGFGALNAVRANSQRILQIAAKFYF